MHDHNPDTGPRPSKLPAPGTLPTFVPTQAALNRALARARHRRLTRGLTLSLAALAVPAAVLFSLPDNGREDSLRLARTPAPTPSPRTEPAPGPTPDATSAPASVPVAPGPAGTTAPAPPPPGAQDGQQPQAPAGPAAPGTPGPAVAADRPGHVEAPRESAGRDCGQVQDGGNGLSTSRAGCIRGQAPGTVRRGQPVDLVTSFCLSPFRTDPAVLSFRGGQEHEILVREQARDQDGFVTGKGRILWTWSRTVAFTQGPHDRTLQPDRCLEWSTLWRTQDQAGKTLPAGEYFVEYRVTASDPWGGTFGNTITLAE